MERLRIEFAREVDDLLGGHIAVAVFEDLAGRKILEIEQDPWPALSVGEAEMQHVAVLDDVVLAFEAELARFARARLALPGDIVVIGDGLGADEALLEVGVDDAGRLRRLAPPSRPSRRAPPSARR